MTPGRCSRSNETTSGLDAISGIYATKVNAATKR
jgi:hypothetical protein